MLNVLHIKVAEAAESGALRRLHRSNGFSFIELLFSTLIVMVLYMLVLKPSEESKQKKFKVECAENLRRAGLALTLYSNEHDGAYPAVKGATTSEVPLSQLVPKYTTDTAIFLCPGKSMKDLKAGEPFADQKISYAYMMGLRKSDGLSLPILSDSQVNGGIKPKGATLFSRDGAGLGSNHHQFGGNVLFTDGHVEACGQTAPRDMSLPAHVELLNPKQ